MTAADYTFTLAEFKRYMRSKATLFFLNFVNGFLYFLVYPGADVVRVGPFDDTQVAVHAIIDSGSIAVTSLPLTAEGVADGTSGLPVGGRDGTGVFRVALLRSTRDWLVQLRSAGVEIDPRARTWTEGAGDTPGRSWTLASGTDGVTAAQGAPAVFGNRWLTSNFPFWRDSVGTLAAPTWRLAAPVTAPAAGAALVTVAAVAGQKHRVYGWTFGKEDAIGNLIQIRDGATVVTGFSGMDIGSSYFSPIPIMIGTVNTALTMNPLNAGAAGIDYVGALLVETAV